MLRDVASQGSVNTDFSEADSFGGQNVPLLVDQVNVLLVSGFGYRWRNSRHAAVTASFIPDAVRARPCRPVVVTPTQSQVQTYRRKHKPHK